MSITAEQLSTLDPLALASLRASVTPHWNKYIAHHPLHPLPNYRQYAFICLDAKEAMYGGAAGGAKSDALLMLGLQYVDVPDYHGIIFRRTYEDLSRAGALIPRSHEWLAPWRENGEAHWNGHNRWTFPSGATLEFGYLNKWRDVYHYQSSDFSFLAFDELTQFEEAWYRYLFSRKRKLKSMRGVPTRVRSGTNPGGIGHDWVYQRFIAEGPANGRVFVPARLEDNPYLDQADYEKSLENLDPVTYAQLRWGDWSVRPPGEFFQRAWFDIVDEAPPQARRIRMWDLAATKNQTSAYTAGARLAWHSNEMYVEDMRRIRGNPGEVESLVKQTADLDGRGLTVWMEQEPGSGGVNTVWRYHHTVLAGFNFREYHPKHDKLTRAAPLAGLARHHGVHLVRGDWVTKYLDEYDSFPNGFKDQVDVCSAGLQVFTQEPTPGMRWLN